MFAWFDQILLLVCEIFSPSVSLDPQCPGSTAGSVGAPSLMAEPMVLDTLKLASTAGLGGWLATLQRTSAEVLRVTCGLLLFWVEVNSQADECCHTQC